MAVTGTIREIEVFEEHAEARLEEAGTGDIHKIFVWSDVAEDYSLNQRLIHGMWLSLLRDAFVNNLTVEVDFSVNPEWGALVSSLKLLR